MKKFIILLILQFIVICKIHSQEKLSQEDLQETLSWINKKFLDNSHLRLFVFQNVEYIENEPILNLVIEPGICDEENEIFKIPIKKLKPITFYKDNVNDYYQLVFETKNGEKFIWYQDKNNGCGSIGTEMMVWLSSGIEKDDLINRIKKAFSHLMLLYGNDGKEKF